MCSHDQLKAELPVCQEIQDKSDQEQAELIDENFASVGNEYSPMDPSRIVIPPSRRRLSAYFHSTSSIEPVTKAQIKEIHST